MCDFSLNQSEKSSGFGGGEGDADSGVGSSWYGDVSYWVRAGRGGL